MHDDESGWYTSDNSTFGDRVTAAREALKLTQAELADRLGITLETLRKWEEDRSEPRANRLQMLAGFLNVSLRWLLTGEGDGLTRRVNGTAAAVLLAEVRHVRDDISRSLERLTKLEERIEQLGGTSP